MQHHIHQKSYKKTKIFIGVSLLVLFVMLVFKYLYVPSGPVENEPKGIATSTQMVNKPKPSIEPRISITPSRVKQGDPAIITVEGLKSTSNVKSFTFNNRPLITFLYNGQVTAFLGVDLNSTPGTFPLVLTFTTGKEIRGEFVIEERAMIRIPFDIPDKLGGNTPESVKQLISTLATESKIINSILTSNQMFWTEKFRSPLSGPLIVQDDYGYTRIIGNSTMPHKGTDIEAPLGTPIYAMNQGFIRFTDDLRNYGKTIVIDHGLGLQTVYMHLSEIIVTNGQKVEKGDLIGKSGDTGYVLGPHLHLTVRIWDVSIDPIKFLELFGSEN